MMALISLISSIAGLVSAVLLVYILLSKRTVVLVYRRFAELLCILMFLFAITEIIEFFQLELIEKLLNVAVALMLFYSMWYHARLLVEQNTIWNLPPGGKT